MDETQRRVDGVRRARSEHENHLIDGYSAANDHPTRGEEAT